jgi:ribosomal-protein-alanine N-acetyltransferase
MALADYIENKPVLQTERLTLRQMLPSDVPALKEWMPDKAMYAYWGKPAGKTDKNPELLAMKAVIDFCFAQTELQRIRTDVDIRNIASWKVLEKYGFTHEGLIRQGRMVNTWCDYYIYGLLKTDVQKEYR